MFSIRHLNYHTRVEVQFDTGYNAWEHDQALSQNPWWKMKLNNQIRIVATIDLAGNTLLYLGSPAIYFIITKNVHKVSVNVNQ